MMKQSVLKEDNEIIQEHRIALCTKDYKEYLNNTDTTNYNENIKNETIEEEELWKKRIIMEYIVERGNIIMNYDLYRKAFTYYSDTQSIPYDLLNNIARKYVIIYRCRGFYEDGMPIDKEVNMNNIKKETATVYKVNNTIHSRMKDGKIKSEETGGAKPPNKPELKKNKIIRVGKINDFSIIHKTTNIEKKKNISYKDYCNNKTFYNDKILLDNDGNYKF